MVDWLMNKGVTGRHVYIALTVLVWSELAIFLALIAMLPVIFHAN
jgi:hypothetical protein